MRRFRPSRLFLAAAPGRGLVALIALLLACKERPASVVPQAGSEISATEADADDATSGSMEVPELEEAAAPEGPAKRPPQAAVATPGPPAKPPGPGNRGAPESLCSHSGASSPRLGIVARRGCLPSSKHLPARR